MNNLNTEAIIFYCIAAFILVTALLSVTTRKIFRSAIWLLFSLVGIAAFYFWLRVEFIAAVQVVVYVGGIVVLIIFSIFLTQQSGLSMAGASRTRVIAALAAVTCGAGLTLLQLDVFNVLPATTQFDWSMRSIGIKMLSTAEGGYALPFEVVSVLLLAAMIGCIVIAMKSPPQKSEPNE